MLGLSGMSIRSPAIFTTGLYFAESDNASKMHNSP